MGFLKSKKFKYIAFGSVTALSFLISFTQCAKSFDGESFAPYTLPQAVLKTATANGVSTLYCSISGGCPLVLTGDNFFKRAKVYVGPYECLGVEISTDNKQINCTIGAGKSGVFDIRVVNIDNQASIVDPAIADPTTLQFSYASFLYVGNGTSPGQVIGYAQNPQTGNLISIFGSPFSIAASADNTYGVTIHPNNKYLYSANVNSNTVSAYAINPQNGRLTAVGAPVGAGAARPNGLGFHPTGNYLFSTNQTANSVSVYAIDSTGAPTLVGTPVVASGSTSLNGIAVESSGHYIYVSAQQGVAGYRFDPDLGTLAVLPGSPFSNDPTTAANTGDGIAIHPNGKWVYMGLYNQKKVASFVIDEATGALSPNGPLVDNGGFIDNQGSGAVISPDGRFFYGTAFENCGTNCSTGDRQVVAYAIDQITGQLTLVSPTKGSPGTTNYSTNGGPNDVRIDVNGSYVYTCNALASPSINAFLRNSSTGELTKLSPAFYSVAAPAYGPGIMVIQK